MRHVITYALGRNTFNGLREQLKLEPAFKFEPVEDLRGKFFN